jgi:catechol 2,3-dioxygenase-like lactoylglutathione lyase family enzyme
MKFKFAHFNFNVLDLNRSIKFYQEALGLTVKRSREAADGSYIITFLEDRNQTSILNLLGLRNIRSPMIWVNRNIIWHLQQRTLKRHINIISKWASSAMKIRRWGFTSSWIPMDIGLKSYRQNAKRDRKILLFLYK